MPYDQNGQKIKVLASADLARLTHVCNMKIICIAWPSLSADANTTVILPPFSSETVPFY
jgi:hypothetical protein